MGSGSNRAIRRISCSLTSLQTGSSAKRSIVSSKSRGSTSPSRSSAVESLDASRNTPVNKRRLACRAKISLRRLLLERSYQKLKGRTQELKAKDKKIHQRHAELRARLELLNRTSTSPTRPTVSMQPKTEYITLNRQHHARTHSAILIHEAQLRIDMFLTRPVEEPDMQQPPCVCTCSCARNATSKSVPLFQSPKRAQEHGIRRPGIQTVACFPYVTLIKDGLQCTLC